MVIYTTKNQADEEKTKQKKTIQAALQSSSSAGQFTSCNLLSFAICVMMESLRERRVADNIFTQLQRIFMKLRALALFYRIERSR